MAHSEKEQIPSTLKTVTSADSNVRFGGSTFTIANAIEDGTVVAVPATVGAGDSQVTLTVVAGAPCPVDLREIVSTTVDIVIGY